MQRMKKVILSGVAVAAVAGGVSGGLVAANSGDEEPLSGSTYERAVAAALAFTGGGTVTETEIGDGGAAYEVEIRLADGRQVEVQLDADFVPLGSEPDDDRPGDQDDD